MLLIIDIARKHSKGTNFLQCWKKSVLDYTIHEYSALR